MNAVIDEDLHRSLADTLKQIGFHVFDIRDHGLSGLSDEKIYAFTIEKKAVLFSADLGFSNILTYPLGQHYGIVILRYPNEMPTQQINQQIAYLLPKIKQKDYEGHLIILSKNKIRIRRQD